MFNIICGVCSIAGLLVSIFTASKVVKIVQTVNSGNGDKIKTTVSKTTVIGDVVGGNNINEMEKRK